MNYQPLTEGVGFIESVKVRDVYFDWRVHAASIHYSIHRFYHGWRFAESFVLDLCLMFLAAFTSAFMTKPHRRQLYNAFYHLGVVAGIEQSIIVSRGIYSPLEHGISEIVPRLFRKFHEGGRNYPDTIFI